MTLMFPRASTALHSITGRHGTTVASIVRLRSTAYAKGETERWPTTDEAVQDYLLIAKREWDRNELRFNEVIEHTGRDLKWLVEKIGPWIPFPPEPKPTVLQ